MLQVVSDFTDREDEGETLLEMMRASGRPLSISLLQAAPGAGYRSKLDLLDAAHAEGLAMRAQVAARAVGVLLGLQGSVNPLGRTPTFQAVAELPLAEQARLLAEPERREQLVAELQAVAACRSRSDRIFELGDPPDYEPAPRTASPPVPQRAGVERPRALRRPAARRRGPGPALPAVPQLLRRQPRRGGRDARPPAHGPGLSDGGAHVGTICDASFPTSLLTHWGRDRTRGTTFDLPFLVQRQCRATAEAVGLLDRGLLAPGYKADVNVIDFDHLALATADDGARPAGRREAPRAGSTRLPAHVRVRRRDLRRRRAHRRPARPPRPRRAGRSPPRRLHDDATPRILEPQCEWTSADVADEDTWTELFDDDRAGRARRRAAPRARRSPTTCSSSGATTSRCPTLQHRLPAHRGRAHQRSRLRAPARRRPPRLHPGRDGGPLLGHRHPPRPARGRRTSTATCSATSPTRTRAIDDPTARGNELGGVALPFHCDGSDLVGLMCLENGRSGGLSAVANSVRIHNQLVAERPDLAAALYDELPVRLPGRAAAGRQAVLPRAGVHRVGGPAVRALHPALHLGVAAPPGSAPAHRAAAGGAPRGRRAWPTTPTNHVLMDLQPGDMQFINNYHVLHGRTAYEDDRGAGHVRHLKRLWLETTVLTSRPPYFANHRTHWSERRTASRINVH